MANICCVNMTFVSKDKETLTKLHQHFDTVFRNEEYAYIGNLMKNHGYQEEEYHFLCSKGDYLSWVDAKISFRGNVYFFSAAAENKWEPHLGIYYILLKEIYRDSIDFYWLAEENGCMIYEKSDVTNLWYPEQFEVDWAFNGNCDCSYFNTYQETIEFVESAFPEAEVSAYTAISKVEDEINAIYENKYPDQDYWFNIHAFKNVNDGYANYKRLVKEVKKGA